MRINKTKIILLSIFILGIFLLSTLSVFAQSGVELPADFVGPLAPGDVTCTVTGPQWLRAVGIPCGTLVHPWCLDSYPPKDNIDTPCELDEIFQTIINFAKLLVAVTGTAALVMFTYGGILFIIATGREEWITKAKETMKAAVIGIIIILGAWLVVNFTIFALTGGEVGDTAQIFTQPFSQQPKGTP